jgi:hypothetical protein
VNDGTCRMAAGDTGVAWFRAEDAWLVRDPP